MARVTARAMLPPRSQWRLLSARFCDSAFRISRRVPDTRLPRFLVARLGTAERLLIQILDGLLRPPARTRKSARSRPPHPRQSTSGNTPPRTRNNPVPFCLCQCFGAAGSPPLPYRESKQMAPCRPGTETSRNPAASGWRECARVRSAGRSMSARV